MFSPAFSAFWIMVGYLILLVLLSVFTAKIGRMKGIKSRIGSIGVIFWLMGVVFYFILAQIGSPDAIILVLISLAAPLFSIINVLTILFNKKHSWKDPAYKKKSLAYLLIFIAALLVYIIGLIIA